MLGPLFAKILMRCSCTTEKRRVFYALLMLGCVGRDASKSNCQCYTQATEIGVSGDKCRNRHEVCRSSHFRRQRKQSFTVGWYLLHTWLGWIIETCSNIVLSVSKVRLLNHPGRCSSSNKKRLHFFSRLCPNQIQGRGSGGLKSLETLERGNIEDKFDLYKKRTKNALSPEKRGSGTVPRGRRDGRSASSSTDRRRSTAAPTASVLSP